MDRLSLDIKTVKALSKYNKRTFPPKHTGIIFHNVYQSTDWLHHILYRWILCFYCIDDYILEVYRPREEKR